MSIPTHPRRLLLVADPPAGNGAPVTAVRRFRLARIQTAGQPAPATTHAKRI